MYCHAVLSTVLVFVVVDVVLGLPVLTYDSGKNCGENLIMKCSFTGEAFDAVAPRSWTYTSTPIIDAGSSSNETKYTESTATSASSYFTMTIKEVTLSDAGGSYICAYNLENSAAVTLEYECYDDTVDITRDNNNMVLATVDRAYPDLPTTILKVTLTNSAATTILGAVTSAASTAYTDHFTVTWTSTDAVPDGTYTYTVVIQTNAAGTPVTIADNLSEACGLTTTQSTTVIIGASAGGACLLLLITVSVVCCCIRKNRNKNKRKENVPMRDIDYESRTSRLKSDQIHNTNRFTPHNSRGQTEIEEMEVRGHNEGIEQKAYDNRVYFGKL